MMQRPLLSRQSALCSLAAFLLLLCSGTCFVYSNEAAPAATLSATEQRLFEDVKYLASDELEGRGIGSKGLDLAAEYVRRAFAKAGLKVNAVEGDAWQAFEMTTGAKLGKENSLAFRHPQKESLSLELEKDFIPVAFGGSGPFSAPIVFAGYGIEAPEHEYNDFEGIDVKGKVVLLMRREPQQGNPHGAFSGSGPHAGLSRHSELRTKVSNAFGRGAAAVILVDDPYSARESLTKLKDQLAKQNETVAEAAQKFIEADSEEARTATRDALAKAVDYRKDLLARIEKGEPDSLMKFGYGGNESTRSIPILHITRATADRLLKASLEKTLADIEKEIDKDLKPRSTLLEGWTAAGEVSIEREKATVKNVIGVLEGEGPLADETIVIGAHYDHVGRGGANSLAPGSNEIHNGADDNASGTAALIELARRFASRDEKPARRLVFIAFTAEEAGLIGSAEYVKNPVFPLEKTIAMFNMDMVGRLNEDKLTVFGTGTAPEWPALLKRLAPEHRLEVIEKPEGFGPSDHSSFYGKKIPVLHFFTGTHTDYHRPSDDWDKINVEGMKRVTNLIEQVVAETAAMKERPEYIAVQATATPLREGSRPYFGSIPDFGGTDPGYALSGVSPGSPADKGGLKGGDRLIRLGQQKIDNLDDFDLALRKFSPGETVDVVVIRDGKEVTLKVTLEKPR